MWFKGQGAVNFSLDGAPPPIPFPPLQMLHLKPSSFINYLFLQLNYCVITLFSAAVWAVCPLDFKVKVQCPQHRPSVFNYRHCNFLISRGTAGALCWLQLHAFCNLASYLYQFVILLSPFNCVTQNPHSLSRNRRSTSRQRWRRWWTSPARREVKKHYYFFYGTFMLKSAPTKRERDSLSRTPSTPPPPLLIHPLQEYPSQTLCGTKMLCPSTRWRCPGTGCWWEAACRWTASCLVTPGCSSASQEMWQERFRPTHTWQLPVSAQAAF